MTHRLTLVLPLLALAACHAKMDFSDTDKDSANVHVAMNGTGADKVSIKAPGFSADVALPNLDLAGKMDLDGIRIAPTSKVTGMDAFADDKAGSDAGSDKGHARLSFTDSGSPAALVAYYKDAATKAGYGEIAATGDTLAARKGSTDFALSVHPDGGGSKGTIVVTGS